MNNISKILPKSQIYDLFSETSFEMTASKDNCLHHTKTIDQ